MKESVKRYSLYFAFLFVIFTLSSIHALAASSLDHSGKMRIKIERISQDDAERKKLESQDQKETELEKVAPDLFKKQTMKTIQKKQAEQKEKEQKMKHILFTVKSKPNDTLKNMQKELFSSRYSAQYNDTALTEDDKESGSGLVSKKTFSVLFGFVFVICGGIYFMMTKMMR